MRMGLFVVFRQTDWSYDQSNRVAAERSKYLVLLNLAAVPYWLVTLPGLEPALSNNNTTSVPRLRNNFTRLPLFVTTSIVASSMLLSRGA